MEDGYVVDRPNRARASARTTRAIVVALLLASAVLMLLVVLGGWSGLQGDRATQIVFIALYVGMAFLVAHWNRGVLPVAAALAILLLIFAAVSAPEWMDRDKTGFSTPETILGSTGFESSAIALLTFLLIPLQVLLIAFAAQAFRQDWHVEVEVPRSRAKWSGARPRVLQRRAGARRGTRHAPGGG